MRFAYVFLCVYSFLWKGLVECEQEKINLRKDLFYWNSTENTQHSVC